MSHPATKVALLAHTLDFAGMFPPASLSFDDTLKKAATYRQTATHPWLMAKVVLGMEQLKQLTPAKLFAAGANGSPWHFSALSSAAAPSDDTAEFIKNLEWDLRELARIQHRGAGASQPWFIDAYEVKLPPAIHAAGRGITAGEYIFPALERAEDFWISRLDVYFEVQLDQPNWSETLEGVAQILTESVGEFADSPTVPGLKIRTGGKYTPTPAQLAEVIDTCSSYGLRFKVTQGLHRPLSHDRDFGFVNVFAALAFAYALDSEEFSVTDLAACLASPSPADFLFSDTELQWREFKLTIDQIEKARKIHATTFGSCSADEPDQYLAKEFP